MEASCGTMFMGRDTLALVGDDKLVLVAEAARATGYSAEWLRQLIDAGKVKGEKVGRYYAMPESEVERLRQEPRSRRGRPRRPPPQPTGG